MNSLSFAEKLWLKCRLLVEGCHLDPEMIFPSNIHHKKIHLYAHSQEKISRVIPEDILIGIENDNPLICRIRYCSQSNLLIKKEDNHYLLYDLTEQKKYPITFVSLPQFASCQIKGQPLHSICSYLGLDLIGVIPSNYCFYFNHNQQCRFCEILPNYKNQVEYPKAIKDSHLICEALHIALQNEPKLQHIAITTGNIKSYDYTFEYFIKIGQELKNFLSPYVVKHVLATLMPPDNFSLIDQLSQTYFNKVYFPVEVYEEAHFKVVCPGKASYGYNKILQGLDYALQTFGLGHVYTNFVYGIQSLDSDLNPASYCPKKENEKALQAVEGMLARQIIPAFTLYHYSGYNKIGAIPLSVEDVYEFFKQWGELVFASGIVPLDEDAVLFSPLTLSNTLFNDAFLMAKTRSRCPLSINS